MLKQFFLIVIWKSFHLVKGFLFFNYYPLQHTRDRSLYEIYTRSTLYRPLRLNRHSVHNKPWLVRQLTVFAMSICFCIIHNAVGCDKQCSDNLQPFNCSRTNRILIFDYLSKILNYLWLFVWHDVLYFFVLNLALLVGQWKKRVYW